MSQINKDILNNILMEWSFWDSKPTGSLLRSVNLPEELVNNRVFVIKGVRRCGKSTLLTQLPHHYSVPLAQCYFCNFEDPRLMDFLDHHLLSQIVSLARNKHSPSVPCYFFFDEIQNVKGWEKWLHTQLERPKQNYYVVTGSNSHLLSGELGTSLTGRHHSLELFPFSFSEYQKVYPKNSLEDYLESGGFPAALFSEKPYQLLQDYFNDIIFRDIANRVHARSSDSLKQVVKMAFETCGSELSYRKIAAIIGITDDTVKTYLEACEQAYLLFACPFFTFSEKKRMLRQKKYYPIDTGLRRAVITSTNKDWGKNLETAFYLFLKKTNESVFYWQEINKGEVDFVAIRGSSIVPFQITWNGPELRHEKSLNGFYEAYPQAEEAVFITKENALRFV